MILFCDFDGTLFRRDVDGDFERNLEAIRKFRLLGNKFVLSTGRGLASIKEVFPDCMKYADYLICDNGSVCFAGDKKMFELTIPRVLVDEVLGCARVLPNHELFQYTYFCDGDEFGELRDGLTKIRLWTDNADLAIETSNRLRERFGRDKMAIFPGHNMRPSEKMVKELGIRENHRGAIDLMAPEAGKENAIRRILEENPGERPVAVGDGANDQDMLRTYHGYIMSTAFEMLRVNFRKERQVDSVAALIERLLVLEDVREKIQVDLFDDPLEFYTDGATNSTVFSARKKYLIKITDKKTVQVQREFLTHNKSTAFHKMLCSDDNLHYECVEFVDGVRYKIGDLPPEETIAQLARIVAGYELYEHNGYGFLGDEKRTWREFLLDEIQYASKRLPGVSQKKVMMALAEIGDYAPEKRLLHGDFGAHNFLLENGTRIRVIDPMPVVGDFLYDFYFAVFSNPKIFDEVSEDTVYRYFTGRDRWYKEALATIALYVRTSRAAVYDMDHFGIYKEKYLGA